jgi:hypothetical protein
MKNVWTKNINEKEQIIHKNIELIKKAIFHLEKPKLRFKIYQSGHSKFGIKPVFQFTGTNLQGQISNHTVETLEYFSDFNQVKCGIEQFELSNIIPDSCEFKFELYHFSDPNTERSLLSDFSGPDTAIDLWNREKINSESKFIFPNDKDFK